MGSRDTPMIETIHHRQRDVNRSTNGGHHLEDDYMFVVEPSKDGNLYIQHKDPNVGLQRLGITVKSLAERTPQSFSDPPLVYTAKQDTALYTVDADTGNVIKSFTVGDTFIDDQPQCRRLGNFDVEEEECEPRRTFDLGRVQYTVMIQSALTGERLCTIKFSEWTPNNRDIDLQSQYVETKDKNHIYSLHDGRIIGIDYSDNNFGKRKFTRVLSSPVARVFDIVRPTQDLGSDTPLVLLSQPLAPPEALPQLGNFDDRASRVFVNCTEKGDWYAFSELTYPMVTSQAEWAKVLRTDSTNNVNELYEDEAVDPIYAYTGIQNLASSIDPYSLRTLPAPDPGSAIGMPSPNDLHILNENTTSTKINLLTFFSTLLVLVIGCLAIGSGIWGKENFKRIMQAWTGNSKWSDEDRIQQVVVEVSDGTNELDVEKPNGSVEILNVTGVEGFEEGQNKPSGQVADVYSGPTISQTETPSETREHATLLAQSSNENEDSGDEDGDEDSNDKLSKEGNDKGEGNGSKVKRTRRGKRGGKKHKRIQKPDPISIESPDEEVGHPDSQVEPKNMPGKCFRLM